jgi:hypothetical protein
MTKAAALQALKDGKILTHYDFCDDEYIFIDRDGTMRDEVGNALGWFSFWEYRSSERFENGWEIYTPKANNNEPEERPCHHPPRSRVLTHRGYHCGDCGKQFN